jgi:hypothetical protein
MVRKYPIKHWSYSSLISYLRNPLAWHKRYVEEVYDLPQTPASAVGQAAHVALQHFYGGVPQEESVLKGLKFLKSIPDFEINFGKSITRAAKKKKRLQMEQEYHQAISFYLIKPPKHKVLGVEMKAQAQIPGIAIPVKAVSDLVVVSSIDKEAVDIIDHKFVSSYGPSEIDNPLFVVQALFNYYTVLYEFKRPVKRFIVYECKKSKNKDGKSQLRKHVIDFQKHKKEFELFYQLLKDATEDLRTRKVFLPNPTDMFDGKNSLDIYRWGLIEN